jgi:hypothetical protein
MTTKDRANQLATEHWDYLQKVIELHYVSAFIHGYKHGVEDSYEESKKGATNEEADLHN